MTPDLIELQNSHVTQYAEHGIKGDWFVRENVTDRDLFTLPSKIQDADIFTIMKFAKEFELKAFNAGINFQKNKHNELFKARIEELGGVVEELTHKNQILADKLNKIYSTENN